MMKHRRLVGIVITTIIATFFGWIMIETLNEHCTNLSEGECCLLWGTAVAALLSAILLVETLIIGKKGRGEWKVQAKDFNREGPVLSSSQVWFRSIARVVLVSLLIGLPIIVKGAFVVVVSGAIVGVCLDGLVRGVMNWLPPVEEDNNS
jgi:hypothetical protein